MNIDLWIDRVELVIAVVGLSILFIKLAELKKGLYAQAASSIYEKYIELDRTFLARPDLRRVFYSPKKIKPSKYDRGEIDAVAEYVVDVICHAYFCKGALGKKAFIDESRWVEAMCKSHAIQDFMRRHRHQYNPQFVSYLESFYLWAPTKMQKRDRGF